MASSLEGGRDNTQSASVSLGTEERDKKAISVIRIMWSLIIYKRWLIQSWIFFVANNPHCWGQKTTFEKLTCVLGATGRCHTGCHSQEDSPGEKPHIEFPTLSVP